MWCWNWLNIQHVGRSGANYPTIWVSLFMESLFATGRAFPRETPRSERELKVDLIARPESLPLLLEHEKSRQTERWQYRPQKAARSAGVGGDGKVMEDRAVLARNTRAVVNNTENCNCVQHLVCAGGVNHVVNCCQPSGSLYLNWIQLLACAGGRSSTLFFFEFTSTDVSFYFYGNFHEVLRKCLARKFPWTFLECINFHGNVNGWKFNQTSTEVNQLPWELPPTSMGVMLRPFASMEVAI